jgi:hypothetical protein
MKLLNGLPAPAAIGSEKNDSTIIYFRNKINNSNFIFLYKTPSLKDFSGTPESMSLLEFKLLYLSV